MRYENQYLVPNLNILINTINCSKKVSLLTASENTCKSRPRHFQLLSKSDLTLSKFHEPRSLWRWGSTRNRRINRFPATELALLLYIYVYGDENYKTVPEQLSAWTIGTDHVIITEHIFSPWEASPLGSQVEFPHYTSKREHRWCVQFYVNKTVCSSSISDITSATVFKQFGLE